MNQVKANTQSCLTKQKGDTKRMHIMCKACVCLNLTISWFLGLAFSSAFVAFSNSTSLHIRQKFISCRIRNSQNKCITVHRRQLKCSSRDSKKKQLIGKMLHPDIRMYILNTVLGTNSIILTRRSCSTIKSFFVFFYHFLYSHDLNVLCSSDMVRRI